MGLRLKLYVGSGTLYLQAVGVALPEYGAVSCGIFRRMVSSFGFFPVKTICVYVFQPSRTVKSDCHSAFHVGFCLNCTCDGTMQSTQAPRLGCAVGMF